MKTTENPMYLIVGYHPPDYLAKLQIVLGIYTDLDALKSDAARFAEDYKKLPGQTSFHAVPFSTPLWFDVVEGTK